MCCDAGGVGRGAGVVAAVRRGQALDEQGGGVLVVGADGDGGRGGGGGGDVDADADAAVPGPGEPDGQVSLQHLAGDGGAHALAQQVVREQEGHDGGRRCSKEDGREEKSGFEEKSVPLAMPNIGRVGRLTHDLYVHVSRVRLVPPAERGAGVVPLVGGLHGLRDHQRAVRKHLLPTVARELVPICKKRREKHFFIHV